MEKYWAYYVMLTVVLVIDVIAIYAERKGGRKGWLLFAIIATLSTLIGFVYLINLSQRT